MRARAHEWDLPGGKIEEREELEEGLRREVYEETGLRLKGLELVVSRGGEWEGAIHEFSYYRSLVDSGEVLLSHEHSMFEWHEPLVASAMVQFRPHRGGLHEVMRQLSEI
jgi:8-oxo-dGTP diphosphatase